MRWSLLGFTIVLATFTGCSSDEPAATAGAETDGDPTATPQRPPTQSEALQEWLPDGAYRAWAEESAIHPSTGPHFGNVRTWVNDLAAQGLQSGGELAVDSATVKELYGDGDTIRGWSVSVKTEAASEGDGWYWFQSFDDGVLADGQGLGVCVGCHGGGTDFVLTPYPLQ